MAAAVPREPIFLRSQTPYESYTDFWTLVRLGGFESLPAEQADFSRAQTFIWPTMDWETVERLAKEPKGARKARIIWWYLERPDAHRRGIGPEDLFRESVSEVLDAWVDEIWVSERSIHRWDTRTRYVPFGSHPELRDGLPAVGNRYDVAHFGQLTPRRAKILDELRRGGFSVTPGGWGPDRAEMLEGSTVFLNIDRVEGLHLSAPLRFALAAAYRIPILSEAPQDADPLVPGTSILTAPYEGLVELVRTSLLGPRNLVAVGNAAHEALCVKGTFRAQVLAGIGA